MKKKELADFRQKKLSELNEILDKKRIELGQVQAKTFSGKEKNNKKGKMLKIEIAQILTLIREKILLEELQNKKERKEK